MLYEPLKMFEFLLAAIIRNFSYAVIRYKINDEKSNNLLSVSCRYNSTCTEYIDKQTLIVWIVRHSFHKYFLRVFPRIGFDCGEFCFVMAVYMFVSPSVHLFDSECINICYFGTHCVYLQLCFTHSLIHSLSLLFSSLPCAFVIQIIDTLYILQCRMLCILGPDAHVYLILFISCLFHFTFHFKRRFQFDNSLCWRMNF